MRGTPDETPVTLEASAKPDAPPPMAGPIKRAREKDVLRAFTRPEQRRLQKIFGELQRVRKADAPNAAMCVTRVMLELAVDHYFTTKGLPFAGDVDPDVDAAVAEFWKELSVAGIKPHKAIRDAIKTASKKGLTLSMKLAAAIQHLATVGAVTSKEAAAYTREINAGDVVDLLNDAMHRLENAPTMTRVDGILEVIRPVFNKITD